MASVSSREGSRTATHEYSADHTFHSKLHVAAREGTLGHEDFAHLLVRLTAQTHGVTLNADNNHLADAGRAPEHSFHSSFKAFFTKKPET